VRRHPELVDARPQVGIGFHRLDAPAGSMQGIGESPIAGAKIPS
jgi:hypothetical protein